MNKIKLYALGLCLLAMASCNNEDKEFLNVGKDGKTSIECSNLDQIVEIPIESSGSWVASLPEDCDWATILTPEGGNGVLRLVVDMNISSRDYTSIRRATTVTVKCGGQTSTIGLTQFAGASANDPGGNSDESTLMLNKGVGSGFDPMINDATYQIFNVNVIADFNDDYEISQSFNVSPISQQKDQILPFDSLESKKDTVSVELTVNVAYGCFKLEVEGKYDSYEKLASNNFKYGIVASLPRVESKLEVFNLLAKYEENEEEKATEKEPDTRYKRSIEGVFSSGFRSISGVIKKAYAEKGKDSREFKNGVATLVNRYGPVVTTGATLGGQLSMNVQADTTNVTDYLNITGKATLAIKSMVSVTAGVGIKYSKEGTALLQKSILNSCVQGGSQEKMGALVKELANSSRLMRTTEEINKAVAEWQQSVVYNKDQYINKTEIIEYKFTGIWNLFPYDMAEDIRLIIVDLYKDKETMVDIKKLLLNKGNK